MLTTTDNNVAQRSMLAAYSNMQKLPRQPLERQNGADKAAATQSSEKAVPAEGGEDAAYEVLPAQRSGATGLYSIKKDAQGAQQISFERPARYEKMIASKLFGSMPDIEPEQGQNAGPDGSSAAPVAAKAPNEPDASDTPTMANTSDAEGEKDAQSASGKPASREEQPQQATTANTDRVDNEIKNLKTKHAQLKKRMLAASDPEKRAELQKELKTLESEISMKDNDAYRRQNTSFSVS